jgi:ABC-type branched-subunit amino acid transport system substrate-binding protein
VRRSPALPLAIVALAVVLGWVAYVPAGSSGDATRLATGAGEGLADDGSLSSGPDDGIGAGGPSAGGGGAGGASRQATQAATKAREGLECAAGRNGGSTDTGVAGNQIRLASTMVQTGPGASFLAASSVGMRAVVQKVNQAGGICGRILDLTLRDDGWDAQRGQLFLRNWIQEGMFALPVVPSSEGLGAAILSRDIGDPGIPVVGSDGMRIDQYEEPWVWPVATATVSTMRSMAKYAFDVKGARSFGIVFDNRFKFGVEGADAFKRFVEGLPGASLKAFVPIEPTQSSYSSEIQKFNEGCGGDGCDTVALLLVPSTAETWIAGGPQFGTKLTSGAQTLFNKRFAENCKSACDGMFVWTGYTPPIGALASTPGVAEFVRDVKAVDPTVDETNAFLQGSYLGMRVFVDALQRVGPDLTRQRLRETLDALDFPTDLASVLRWRPGQHHANVGARAFSIVVSNNAFAGFRDEQTGWVADPELGG